MKDNLFKKTNIFLDVNVSKKKEACNFIAKKFVELNFSDNEKKCFKGLYHREKESSTGFIDGFAIPHAKLKEISKPGLILLTFDKPVKWNSADDKPIKYAFAIALPDDNNYEKYSKMLGTIATALVSDDFRLKMKKALTLDAMYDLIKEII